MFDLKRPCITCPFRKGQGHLFQLTEERLTEIRNATAFQCHKTVDYDHFNDQRKRQGDHPQQCAGLMAVLIREGKANAIMRVAGLFGVSLTGIDPEGDAYETWADVLEAHK
jgi:hypothetical protein